MPYIDASGISSVNQTFIDQQHHSKYGGYMIYELIKKLDNKMHFSTVSAHCDIPCKIYDPITAQIATLTMIRMVDLLVELQNKAKLTTEEQVALNFSLRKKSQKIEEEPTM